MRCACKVQEVLQAASVTCCTCLSSTHLYTSVHIPFVTIRPSCLHSASGRLRLNLVCIVLRRGTLTALLFSTFHYSIGMMAAHAGLWTEELQLSRQQFVHLHSLLNPSTTDGNGCVESGSDVCEGTLIPSFRFMRCTSPSMNAYDQTMLEIPLK